MDKIRIVGGRPLTGEVTISGAKNSALPCICAALLSAQPIVLNNVPRRVRDVATVVQLLEHLGINSSWENNTLHLQANEIDQFEAPYDMVKTMRASVLVLGPLV